MYIKPEVKKWYNSHKWSSYRVIRWKLLFHGEGMTLLIAEELNFIKEIFGGQWGIILGDNPAGHCFVLRNLVPMSFLLLKMYAPENKMIMLLKMHVSGRIFDKICPKAIKTVFSNMWSVIRELVDSIFWWGWKFKHFDSQGDTLGRGRGNLPLYFFLKNRTPNPIPFVKWGNSSYD